MIQFSHAIVLISLLVVPVLLIAARRRTRSALMRAVTLVLLIVALAGPQLTHSHAEHTAIFLIDRSPSVVATSNEREIHDMIASVAAANPDYQFGSISFGDRAVVTEQVTDQYTATVPVNALGEGTNLGAAVELALASDAHAGDTQLVLVSDGRITAGLDKGLSMAQQADVPISVLSVGTEALNDLSITRLDAPPTVEVDQPFTITATVAGNAGATATLVSYRNSDLIAATDITLTGALTRFTLSDSLSAEGTYSYRVSIKGEDDPIVQNDTLVTSVRTDLVPQLLVVTPREDAPVIAMLRSIGKPFIRVAIVPPLAQLATYHEVLLAGITLADLPSQTVTDLRRFVADLGGGLMVVQGEGAVRGFAGGGIEDILPVSYTIPQRGRTASMALVYLLDHSASMRSRVVGASKIDILKESVAASVGLLDEDALVGAISFDREYSWLVPLQPVGDGTVVYQELSDLSATGGTDIYYPIVAALDALESVDARTKHILLFSDGKTVNEYRDYPGLLARLQESDITLSAIAIGEVPNVLLLGSLVQAGDGTLYSASDVSNLPQISIQATQRLSRGRFIADETAIAGSIVSGNLSEMPTIDGHVLTYAKPSAEVLLWAGDDPLFSRWRLGAGQVSVLNTDLDGSWSGNWLSWDKAGLLVDTLLGTVQPIVPPSLGLFATAEIDGAQIDVLADARDDQGGFANFLDLSAMLLATGEEEPMRQVGAGLYRTSFRTPAESDGTVRIVDHTRDRATLVPLSVPYAREYAETGVDETALAEIAASTGGRVLEDEIMPAPRPIKETVVVADIHSWFLFAALALFLGELALRKLPRRFA